MLPMLSLGQIDSLRQALDRSDGKEKLPILELMVQSSNNHAEALLRANELFKESEVYNDLYHQAMAHHYRGVAKEGLGKIDESVYEHRMAIGLFRQIDRPDKEARQWINLGNRYAAINMYDSALSVYKRGEVLATQVQDSLAIYGAIMNASTIHHDRGQREKEMELLLKARAVCESICDPDQLALLYYNMAVFYHTEGEIEHALEMADKAMRLYEETGNLYGQGSVHTLWAEVYFSREEFEAAMASLDQAAEAYTTVGSLDRTALTLMNQGALYGERGNATVALKKLSEAKAIYEQIGDQRYAIKADAAMAKVVFKSGRKREAIAMMVDAQVAARRMHMLQDEAEYTMTLSEAYTETGAHALASEALKRYISIDDSINLQNRERAIAEMETRFRTAVKELEIDKLLQQQKLDQLALQQEHDRFIWASGAAGLLAVMIVLIGFGWYQKQRDNRLIRAQKATLEEQHKEIAHQKLLVEEKNREITDSIVYAKRIQEAILPEPEFWQRHLPDSFVLYQPKDIVAGDFFWLEECKQAISGAQQNTVLFAAADCTGHGVPGAMVSVVCHGALTRSVREFNLCTPAEVLNKTRELVIETFEGRGDISREVIKDGMDIALCSLNKDTLELKYTGAHNSLWIISRRKLEEGLRVSDSEWSLYEFKAQKQPVGVFDMQEPFTEHSIQLEKGDRIYVFSDGYADQFGGSQGKKYKVSSLRQALLDMQEMSMDEQCNELIKIFDGWKGNLAQVDDVCLIGINV